MNNQGLAKRIKSIREGLGKSQEEFGQLFDPPAPKSAVSRWEHGGSPNKRRLAIIAKLGNISVDELINGSLDETIAEIIDEAGYLYSEYLTAVSKGTVEDFITGSFANRTLLRNYADFFKCLDVDSYVPFPVIPENGQNISKEQRKQLMDQYYDDNFNAALRYCIQYAIARVKSRGRGANNKTLIVRFMANAADNHLLGETDTNDGVFTIANNGLDNIRNKLYSVTNIPNTDSGTSKEVAGNVDPELFNSILALIDNAQDQLDDMYSSYFGEDDDEKI